MDNSNKPKSKFENKQLKGSFTHSEVKERLKKRCIETIKENRKKDLEKARLNNLKLGDDSIKNTLVKELKKLKEEKIENNINNVNNNNQKQNDNTVNNNNSNNSNNQNDTPNNNNNNNNDNKENEVHYGNSVEFEDFDFEIDENETFGGNQNDISNVVYDNENDVSVFPENYNEEQPYDGDEDDKYSLTSEEVKSLLIEIQESLDADEEYIRIYEEMEKAEKEEIENFYQYEIDRHIKEQEEQLKN